MGHCCHGNNLPNPVSETYLNGNLSAPLLQKSRFISDTPVSLSSSHSPLSWCVWPWLVAPQRQHSQEVFKQIIEPAAKLVGLGCVRILINTEKKNPTKTLEEQEWKWVGTWRWFNSNCHVPAWNGDRLILALIWIYKMILSHLGRELGVNNGARGKKLRPEDLTEAMWHSLSGKLRFKFFLSISSVKVSVP